MRMTLIRDRSYLCWWPLIFKRDGNIEPKHFTINNVREFAIRVYTNPKKGGPRAWQKRLFVTARI